MAKVMLVEDDNNLREIYEARMQAEGYDVVSAKDGEEALVVAKAEKPELVISDVMMPKISGFEMLDILRNTDGLKDVKVIMLTALGQADDQQRADRLGADRYLVKSQVTLEDIVNVAHQLLGDLPEEATPAPVEPVAVLTPAPVPVAEPATEPVIVPVPAPVPTPAPLAVTEPIATPQTTFSAVQVEPPVAAGVINPAPAVEPIATTAAAPVTVDNGAQSAAQEEATVEAQIEDFVSGATSDAPAPVAAPTPVTLTETQPVVTAERAANAVADDKIMADAVNNLVANTTVESVPVPPTAELVVTPSPESVVALSPAEETAASGVPIPDASVSMIAGKKIISPLSNVDAKPDLNALLAKEEAKEIVDQAATVAGAATPTVVPTPPAPGMSGKPDPSSIAL